MPDAAPTSAAPNSALLLLLRVNLLSSWRRLKSLRQHSRLLTGVIAAFLTSYLFLAFWLFYIGLKFYIAKFPGIGTVLMERLIFLLFAFLFVLLLLSNLVISYTNFFRNRETNFLFTLPISRRAIFQWKLVESTLLASWAFMFLIAPLLVAYGLTRGVAWHFYPVTVLLVGMFIVLPAVAGSWIAVKIARSLDRRSFQILAVGVLLAVLAITAFWLRPIPPPPEGGTRVFDALDKMLWRTDFAQHPFLPSGWLSSSVLYWSEGAILTACFYFLVLLSYVLFFGVLAWTSMGNFFYDAFSAVNSRGSVFANWHWFQLRQRMRRGKTSHHPGLAERVVALVPLLQPGVRAFVVKDLRMFWRDTTQWAQSVLLFGLLAVYIFNLRHFSQQLTSPFWLHLVSFLNLGACSLNLATLTTRFVYPQFSLEGKRLWIVGLAPLGLRKIVRIKFWLATTTALVITLFLISLSCYMLKMDWPRTVFFTVAITIMTFTLTSLAVGLGTLYPNFKEDNPSKIVSGFGGTFCLVLSFLYILGSVVALAFATPWPGSTAAAAASRTHPALCLLIFGLLSLGLGWVPLQLGLRRLRNFEL